MDLVSGNLSVYNETYPDLVQAIMSSAGFPFVFPLVGVEGRLETDGGLYDFAPLQAPIDAGADEIYILSTQPTGSVPVKPAEEFHSIVDVALRVIPMMVQNTLRDDLKVCNLYNDLAAARLRTDKRIVTTHLIEPSQHLGDPLDFSGDLVRKQITQGYEDARAWWDAREG